MTTSQTYMLANQASELDRLQYQSRVWEPSGRRLLQEIGELSGARVVDVGCGAIGWLRLLSEWVGPQGEVVGTDIDEKMLAAAGQFAQGERLTNVTLLQDDLFTTRLAPASFDLVHARALISPLGRGSEQLEIYTRLLRPGGIVVLEDPDIGSWHFNPPAPALERMIEHLANIFAEVGDAHAGRRQLELLRGAGIEGNVRAEVLALPPGHPYLRLPLQQADGLKSRLASVIGAGELEQLYGQGEEELRDPHRWGTTFTLLQAWGQKPA